ncbi:MAG: hypothetical protein HKO08_10865, partial [Erythrobacter sp.]|nr:hypothetical protein [Erythrobacter sp.]
MLERIDPDMLAMLRARHAEPQRHYHDWTHIAALLGHLERAKERVADREAVLHAILFHDAIYDPQAKDNERRSAELLVETGPPISPSSLDLARTMILATEGHYLPESLGARETSDTAHFLDMDLAILGATKERFDVYEKQIRQEYAHVPEDRYRDGRSAVLRSFAGRKRLYFSEWGRARFED